MSQCIDGSVVRVIDRLFCYHDFDLQHVWVQKNDSYRYGVDYVLDGSCSVHETYRLRIITERYSSYHPFYRNVSGCEYLDL